MKTILIFEETYKRLMVPNTDDPLNFKTPLTVKEYKTKGTSVTLDETANVTMPIRFLKGSNSCRVKADHGGKTRCLPPDKLPHPHTKSWHSKGKNNQV